MRTGIGVAEWEAAGAAAVATAYDLLTGGDGPDPEEQWQRIVGEVGGGQQVPQA